MSKETVHRDLVALSVTEVMSQPVICVSADTMLGDVLAAMLSTNLRHLVVVDDGGSCRGVVGDRALAAAWATDHAALK